MTAELRRILLETCVLVAFGVLVGLSINHQMVIDAFTGKLATPAALMPEPQAQMILPVPVLLDEVRQLQSDGAVLVDARSPELYADGHLPGALSLPLAGDATDLSGFVEQVPRGQTIVAYCSGYGCPDSFDLGMLLLAEGYLDVRVFEGGLPEWRDAGLPVATGAP